MVDLIPNNLEEIIALRLELTQQEKNVIKESIDGLDAKIKSAINHIGVRPKETDAELVAAMNKLEHIHNTTSSTNALERVFMYDIKKLNEKKKYLVEYNALQGVLDELKNRRTALQRDLREKDASLDELYLGSRKLKLAEKIGCSACELIEEKHTVPVDKLPQIIGKGGATLQKIESDCKVAIDAKETKSGNIRVTGTKDSIELAIAAILTIVSAISEEVTLADEKCVCLIIDKNFLAHDIEARHDVRIDVSRSKKLCKVSGQPENVRGAIEEIRSTPSLRVQIPIEVTILPSVVGKAGATIKALSEGNRVIIDIEREAKLIIVSGFADDTRRVASVLLDIITEKTEIEEIIKIDKNTMYGCIIGVGGQTVRNLQKELNVQIKSDKVEKGSEKIIRSELETLVIRGVTSKVIAAKAKILQLLQEYRHSTSEILVPDDLIAVVVGKKGAKISLMREKYPDASIDIEENTVKIQCANSETREAILASIDELIKANYSVTVPISLDLGIAMKGSRGVEARAALTALNLQFDILPEAGGVKMKGLKESVISGMEALEVFLSNNFTLEMSCHEEDFSTIFNMAGTDGSIKTIEATHRVEIRPVRKESSVRIRGERGDTENARAALEGLLMGDVHLGSTVFPIDPQAFASIIGKGGATLKKFETDNDVKVDLLKSRSAVRIRGEPDAVQAGKLTLLRFVDDIKAMSSVTASTLCSKDSTDVAPDEKSIQKAIDAANCIFQIDINMEKGTVTFRGNLYLVEEAKSFITNTLTDKTSHCELLPVHISDSVRKLEKDFDAIRSKHGVTIQVLPDLSLPPRKDAIRTQLHLEVKGTMEGVKASKVLLVKLLKRMYPSECLTIPLPASCLKELGNVVPYEVAQSCWGAALTIDRQMSCVRIMGEDQAIADAAKVVESKLAKWCEHHASVPVEDYMLPTIIGKNGASILALQKELHIKIHLNRSAMLLELETTSSTNPDVLQEALKVVSERVLTLKQHSWSTEISPSSIGLFVGKSGVRINKIRTDSGANIEVNKTTGTIELRGTESAVEAGKELVLEILKDMPQTSLVQMKVPARAFPLIIGPKGVKATEITELSGARFDLDRVKEIATLKGSPEACQKLKELIEEILAEEGLTASQVVEDVPEVHVVDSGHYKDLGPIPGAVYDAAAAAAYKARQADLNMSKSAVRRRKRKEADNGEKEEEVVEHKGKNGLKTESVKSIVIPQKKEIEKQVVNSHAVVSNGHAHVADVEDDEHDPSNYSDSNIPTPQAEEEEEEEEEGVLESGISHEYSESTSPDPTLDADSYSGSQLSSGSVEGMGSMDRDTKHIPKGVCMDAVHSPVVEVKAREVPRVSPSTTQPALPSVDVPKTVLAGGKVASSSGLLGMLLGHNNGAAVPVREEKEKQDSTKYSAELEKLLSSLSTSVPPSESSAKSLKASPKAVTDLDNDGNKGGYYKSKSGFSVRL